jgi:hypothetical protein
MKGAFLQLQECRVEPRDWGQIIAQLSAQGITLSLISDALGCSHVAVSNWKNKGFQPQHHYGEALLAMHAKYCSKDT